MKKTLLASLGLTLMLSTSASVALAEENPLQVAKNPITTSEAEYHEQEPNDSFEQANYYFIGDAVIGRLGTEGVPGVWENYDVFRIKAFESNNVQFTVQGDRYSDSWLELELFDSNGKHVKQSRDSQYFLNVNLEKGKEYFLTISASGLQPEKGHIFDYRIYSEAVR
ncbi:hypothetical protein [Paenibacillus sp. CH40]|uniref:hypothetical protein n=1 Tax=Paenibacillus sp. CH40 TaxID=2962045 RepID=UPI0020B84445|nr:hypothetical protein [Paenibacillus sp. CH40]MCP3794579.1 hypothetical protein [Paenibacillus sp. CH40]